MGWELRGGQRYYYRKKREGGRVISQYWGRNEMAELLAKDAEEDEFIARTQGEIERADRSAESDMDRQLTAEAALLGAIVSALLRASGFHHHRGQWRRNMKNKKIIVKNTSSPSVEITKLQERMSREKVPDPKDVARFRELAVEHPYLWPYATQVSQGMRDHIVNLITDGGVRAIMLAGLDILKKELGYESAPALEKLLIDHILTARTRLYWVEHRYTQRIYENTISFEGGTWWDNLLSSANNRFLRAVETLARVRRLAKNSPLFQVNIANEGGRQFVVGEMQVQHPSGPVPRQQTFLLGGPV
jgi:hypothetical protein